jgi:hypothetical protein
MTANGVDPCAEVCTLLLTLRFRLCPGLLNSSQHINYTPVPGSEWCNPTHAVQAGLDMLIAMPIDYPSYHSSAACHQEQLLAHATTSLGQGSAFIPAHYIVLLIGSKCTPIPHPLYSALLSTDSGVDSVQCEFVDQQCRS